MPRLRSVYDSKKEVSNLDSEMAKDWISDVYNGWITLCITGYSTDDELSGVNGKGSPFSDIDPESVSEQLDDP